MQEDGRVVDPDNEATSPKEEKKTPLWDSFKNTPRKPEIGTNMNSDQYNFMVKVVKLFTYIVVTCVVLFSAVLSKATLLLMTSQLKKHTVRPFCNKNLDVDRKFVVELPIEERVLWIWVISFTYFVPQIATFIKSLQVCLFKNLKMDGIWSQLPLLFLTEMLPVIGSAILVFCILPELDVVKAAMLTNAFCFIPGVMGGLYRNSKSIDMVAVVLDITGSIAQLTSFVLWPLIERNKRLYLIPVSAIFISFGWWQNYVDENTEYRVLKFIATKKKKFHNGTYFLYMFVSITNCVIFFVTTLVIFWIQDGEIGFLFNNFHEAFSDRKINVTEVENYVQGLSEFDIDDTYQRLIGTAEVERWTAFTIFLINSISSYICYTFVKFACKVSIQKISFAFPINLTVPVLLSILIAFSGEYLKDECTYRNILPEYLFFTLPPIYLLEDFITQQYAWAWLLWLLSQAWITIHVWNSRGGNLVKTEKLFIKPMYDPFLIDQSVCMNQRRYVETAEQTASDKHPTVYVCATMWREEPEEMMTFMESIMRLDEDYSAHFIAHSECGIPDYYSLESHIFFDNAFIPNENKDTNDLRLNKYVVNLKKCVKDAAREVHRVNNLQLEPPTLFSTPYGGRIEWILPGKSHLIIHLKDQTKIRSKKRWSQVMYLYYLIGHKMKCQETKGNLKDFELKSKNTYILALDGDIDFKPDAMHYLIECMTKNEKLGAACGRIHPVGTGVLAWYQVFEYAVGHWMQKASEHVIGCVLCSPGCFSLFRASALSKDGVMAKYATIAKEARHKLQYDQGEDRWLCTLILKAGYRIEYAAASDSYTHCPTQFEVFYNQRKRWIPSTMANIVDVLEDYKFVVKKNDSISMIYIYYQMFLLIGTIIGPGTIFLMLVGASVTVFQFDQWTSFLMNLLPILIFVFICSMYPTKLQIKAAAILSSIYGLLMMAVLIGIILQIQDDGIMAPTSLFFFFMLAQFVLAALIHPKEFYCLKYGIIYYVTVPSMYMLLMIYSVFNLHDAKWGTREANEKKNVNEGENEKKNFRNTIKYLSNRLMDAIEAPQKHEPQKHEEQPDFKKSSTSDTVVNEISTKVEEESWFRQKELKSLSPEEMKFWTTFIDNYLKPVDEEESEMKKNLVNLRDEMVSAFFMLNALFVLVVFILTLKKDLIHIDWPYNAKINFTYIQSENEVEIMKDYLHLEPIGFVFLISFGAILLIQSFGMFIHRFETFSHIMATTHINWFRKNDTEEAKPTISKYKVIEQVKSDQKLCHDGKQEDDNGESKRYYLDEAYLEKKEKRKQKEKDSKGKGTKDIGIQIESKLRKLVRCK